jgi:YesN/AraC family two-component response regulator
MGRILIVDDEAHMRLLVGSMLEPLGHALLTAENGVVAARLLASEEIDLVITDLVMPEKNGIDLIMEIRRIAPAVKIVAMSGGGGINGRFDYLPIANLIGAAHILSKPFTRDALSTVVVDLMK